MRYPVRAVGFGLLAPLCFAATAWAQGAPARPSDQINQCFDITRHQGVLALNDHTVLVRVDANLYQLDLAEQCPGLERQDPTITLVARSGPMVCGKLDYDLRVGEGGVMASSIPCTVASQRRLTPDEVAAIPRNKRP